MKITRRGFLKTAAVLGAVATLGGYANSKKYFPNELFAPVEASPAKEVRKVKSICSFCAMGCGYIGVIEDGVFTKMEPWVENPINEGKMCCKGASLPSVTNSPRRLRYPMEKSGGKWRRISWEEALDKVAERMKYHREKHGPDSLFFCGLVHGSNEEAYMFRKFAMLFGTNNIDHQARICHSTTVAGLLNTFGHGAMTNTTIMMRHAKCHFFMGSNAAEAHPVFMKNVFNARDENGAKIVVADPRFTRTAAFADLYLRFRPGSDIALVNGLIREIIKNNWVDWDYVNNRTYGFEYVEKAVEPYTPEVVEDITWVPAEDLKKAARMLAENRPSNVIWSMGATQHSVGTQIIRSFAILNCILGNQGQWGGGCVPIRGHDNVQGVTDMCVLSHFLPGYYSVKSQKSWDYYAKVFNDSPYTSGKITPEELKARFGGKFTDASGKEKDLQLLPGFTVSNWYNGVLLPPIEEIDQPTNIHMAIFWGEAISSITEMKKEKEALEKLDMLVIVDPFPTAAAALPERKDGIILLPASTRQEGSGSVTDTGRGWFWRDQVIPPMFDSRPDMWILQELAKRLGFGDHFDYKSIEDVTREINMACRPIGLQGQTPERLKRQKEYAHLFSPKTGRATAGPVDGEWWGLPWPCWTDTHPGTPVLYSDLLPVNEGGHDVRAKWKYPADEPNAGEPIVRGDTPSYGSAVPQYAGYATDLTGEVVRRALSDGNPPTGRGRARLRIAGWADEVPVHREPIESPRPDLVEKYPTYPDQPFQYRICNSEFATEQQRAIAEKRYEKYPIVLTSGRQVEHHGGGAQTRSSYILAELMPEVYVEINPKLAAEKGIKDGDMVWVESARGKIKVKAKLTERVNEKTAFVPFHWNGIFEGEDYSNRWPEGTAELVRGDSVNIITSPGVDQVTQMQETKVALCNIYKA
jgi:formate dehydrogenase major subunit